MISFRNAKLDDLKELMEIEVDCFKIGVREKPDVFAQRISVFPDGFILMLEDDDVIGYACGEIWSKDVEIVEKTFTIGHNPCDVHNPNGTRLYISSIGILQSRRGGGKGSLLFDTLISRVVAKYKNVNELILIVADNWEAAKKIYYKQGFEEISMAKSFFNPEGEAPADGIIMSKKINS
ncbi:MAG: GNAT family N-acetyltransferase [Alphaproteobacteria bacterium]